MLPIVLAAINALALALVDRSAAALVKVEAKRKAKARSAKVSLPVVHLDNVGEESQNLPVLPNLSRGLTVPNRKVKVVGKARTPKV